MSADDTTSDSPAASNESASSKSAAHESAVSKPSSNEPSSNEPNSNEPSSNEDVSKEQGPNEQASNLPAARRAAFRASVGRILPIVLVVAFPTTLLVAPRPTRPRIVPLPLTNPGALAELAELDRARASRAKATLLPHDVRAVGELFRRVGLRMYEKKPYQALTRELEAATKQAEAKHGAESLLALRALQSELFLEAVRSSDLRAAPSVELRELGGDFATSAAREWMQDDEIVLSDEELALLFRVRWGRLTGTFRARAYGPTLDEFRAYYGTYLEHAHARGGPPAEIAARQIAYVRALRAVDPSYPEAYALGALASMSGDFETARAAFARHLARHPGGAYSLAARNHLLELRELE